MEDKTALIDLHTHTTASDGSLEPAELVRLAHRQGLRVIAITDHDTVDGIDEALKEGDMLGLTVIPGVEISVDFDPEMHILGYFDRSSYNTINAELKTLRENRNVRNPRIISKLNEMGFDISLEEAAKEASGGVVGRPHIAAVMIKKGYVASVEEAFDKYLSSGKPAYFKKEKLTPQAGIALIAAAGGAAVLAHPVHLYMNYSRLDSLLAELKAFGLMGIEAYYADNSGRDTGMMLRLAIKHGLLTTGGSDFHGSFRDGISLGVGKGNLHIPYEIFDSLNAVIKKNPS